MTAPLPARPQGIRTSPDGLSVAVEYRLPQYIGTTSVRWLVWTMLDNGMVDSLQLLTADKVVGWEEWSPPPMEMPPRTDARAKTVQDVVDGLPPGTEVT